MHHEFCHNSDRKTQKWKLRTGKKCRSKSKSCTLLGSNNCFYCKWLFLMSTLQHSSLLLTAVSVEVWKTRCPRGRRSHFCYREASLPRQQHEDHRPLIPLSDPSHDIHVSSQFPWHKRGLGNESGGDAGASLWHGWILPEEVVPCAPWLTWDHSHSLSGYFSV